MGTNKDRDLGEMQTRVNIFYLIDETGPFFVTDVFTLEVLVHKIDYQLNVDLIEGRPVWFNLK